MVLAVFVGIGFCVIGIFLFLKPDVYWKLTEKWKSYRADGPSDFYILNTKFGGAMFVLLGIAMMILPWILE